MHGKMERKSKKKRGITKGYVITHGLYHSLPLALLAGCCSEFACYVKSSITEKVVMGANDKASCTLFSNHKELAHSLCINDTEPISMESSSDV